MTDGSAQEAADPNGRFASSVRRPGGFAASLIWRKIEYPQLPSFWGPLNPLHPQDTTSTFA